MLATFLGEDREVEEFWLRVKTNLQAGRIRMVFLADSIPAELRRVVEFMNEQTSLSMTAESVMCISLARTVQVADPRLTRP